MTSLSFWTTFYAMMSSDSPSSSSLGSHCVPWLGEGLSMPSPNYPVRCCPLPDRHDRGHHPSTKKNDVTPTMDHIGSLHATVSHYRWTHASNGRYLQDMTPTMDHIESVHSTVSHYNQPWITLNLSTLQSAITGGHMPQMEDTCKVTSPSDSRIQKSKTNILATKSANTKHIEKPYRT